ncbi:MAG: hypothetical protein V3T18_08730 [Pseudomonadales bacterium]
MAPQSRLALLTALFCIGTAHAQTEFILDLEIPSDETPIVLRTAGDEVIETTLLIPSSMKDQTVRLHLSRLTSDRDHIQPEFVAKVSSGSERGPDLTLELDRLDVDLRLYVPALPAETAYQGTLRVTGDAGLLKTWVLHVSRPDALPAKLLISRKAIALPVTLSGLRSNALQFTLQVHDEGGEALETVTVTQVDVEGSGALDLYERLAVKHGTKFTPVAQSDVVAVRVAPRERKQLVFQLSDLLPGSYTTNVLFSARNSEVDSAAQTLALTVNAKDGWTRPILVLVAAILVSWFATKYLTMRRDRSEIRRLVTELKPAWLKSEPDSVLLISYVADLRRIQDRTKRRFITGIDRIKAELKLLECVLPILDRMRMVRQKIDQTRMPLPAKRQFHSELNQLVRRLGQTGTDAKNLESALSELLQLSESLEGDAAEVFYEVRVSASIDEFLATYQHHALEQAIGAADPASVPGNNQFVSNLHDAVKDASAKQKFPAIVEWERHYVWLKLLWQRRKREEFVALLGMRPDVEGFDAFCEAADAAAIKSLKVMKLVLTSPDLNPASAPEAYDNVVFCTATTEEKTATTYFFKHELRFHWMICLESRKESRWRKVLGRPTNFDRTLEPTTEEPRVVQFLPLPGSVTVRAKVTSTDGEEIWAADARLEDQRPRDTLTIRKSTVFETWRSLRWTEFWATITAAVIALVSGLSSFYVGNDSFGSTQDYVSLFIWGAAIDQSKNFLQQLQATG